jgi:uncharacterized protein (DUF433 family)
MSYTDVVMDWRTRISSDPAICHGQLCIKGTRIPLPPSSRISPRARYWKPSSRATPRQVEDVRASLAYAADLAGTRSSTCRRRPDVVFKIDENLPEEAAATLRDLSFDAIALCGRRACWAPATQCSRRSVCREERAMVTQDMGFVGRFRAARRPHGGLIVLQSTSAGSVGAASPGRGVCKTPSASTDPQRGVGRHRTPASVFATTLRPEAYFAPAVAALRASPNAASARSSSDAAALSARRAARSAPRAAAA